MDSNEFPVNETLCYLNHAAVAPWPRAASEAVAQFAGENMASGAAGYPAWLETESALRSNLAELLNADQSEIALVKNTSEALSFVAYGIDWQAGDVVVIPDEEFPSNSIVWESLQSKGVVVKKVSVKGEHPESEILSAIADKPRLISVSAVQYASGIRLDLGRIGEACRKSGVLYCIDAIQAVGALQFDVREYQCDFAMADGHKWLLGPEGLGFFYVKRERMELLSLNEYGWHMIEHPGDYYRKGWEVAKDARRFECGSPNLLAATALKSSTDLLLATGMANVESLICERTAYLADALQKHDASIITPANSIGRSGIITFGTGEVDPVDAWRQLMAKEVVCMHRGGGIRFSPHFHTPLSVLEKACDIAAEICRW